MDAIHEQDIPTVILLGTVGMLLLIGCMALFILMYQKRILKEKQKRALQELDYQSKMIRLQFESQEQERKRIGANLHDSLGSLLWGAKVNASLIQRSIELNDKALDSYKELTQILDDSIEEVRRISWELTPEAFHYSGLSQSVKKLCARLNGPNQKIEMSEVGGRLWNDERGLQVYRIAQELITNAHKHSGASIVNVSLTWTDQNLNMVVDDNGTGFDPNKERKGVGLWNIEQRVKQLNAKIKIGKSPMSNGVEICIDIPLYS
jgi:signal transduction histidine kinase